MKNNFDNRYNSFAISCKNVLDKIVPWKKNCARGNHSPFMNKVLSKAIMVRTKLKNTFQKNRSMENKKATKFNKIIVFHFCGKVREIATIT